MHKVIFLNEQSKITWLKLLLRSLINRKRIILFDYGYFYRTAK